MSFQYPLDESWTKEEMVDVVNFFTLIEKAYEHQIQRDDIIALYRRFKQIVPSKSEEKQLFSKFNKSSGYAPFPVIKRARESNDRIIHMK